MNTVPPSTANDTVAFGLLGPLLVTTGEGTPIYVSAPKQRTMLAALLLRASRLSRLEARDLLAHRLGAVS